MNQDQIEQYVRGRMSEADARAFEEYCVANPEFARQVEFEQRLKAGMTQVARGPIAEFVRSGNPLRWNLAAAASILFVSAFGLWFWHTYVPPTPTAIMVSVGDGKSRVDHTLRLALIRGNDLTPVLPSGRVRVQIVGLFDTGSPYSVALDRLDTKRNVDTIATLYGQQPASPVTLEVVVDSKRLEPGTYSLRVRKQASEDEALDFEFLKN
jgi:hypothetical protein